MPKTLAGVFRFVLASAVMFAVGASLFNFFPALNMFVLKRRAA